MSAKLLMKSRLGTPVQSLGVLVHRITNSQSQIVSILKLKILPVYHVTLTINTVPLFSSLVRKYRELLFVSALGSDFKVL